MSTDIKEQLQQIKKQIRILYMGLILLFCTIAPATYILATKTFHQKKGDNQITITYKTPMTTKPL